MALIRLALAVLHDAHGRVLVQLREPDKPYGGMWGLVGGHIDPGETPEDAARREVREETGFTVGDLTPFGHVTADGFTMLDRGAVILFTGKTNLVLLPRPKDAE